MEAGAVPVKAAQCSPLVKIVIVAVTVVASTGLIVGLSVGLLGKGKEDPHVSPASTTGSPTTSDTATVSATSPSDANGNQTTTDGTNVGGRTTGRRSTYTAQSTREGDSTHISSTTRRSGASARSTPSLVSTVSILRTTRHQSESPTATPRLSTAHGLTTPMTTSGDNYNVTTRTLPTGTPTIGNGGSASTTRSGQSEITTTRPRVMCRETGYERTIIMLYYATPANTTLFFRGGLSGDRKGADGLVTIRLSYTSESLGTASSFRKYYYWAGGDTKLDWLGAESGQRRYNGVEEAFGSPAARTTNVQTDDAYYYVNRIGPDYWVLDTCMKCSDTYEGWFEFKSFMDTRNDKWEPDVSQNRQCMGSGARTTPFTSTNHMGLCGRINIFIHGDNNCVINYLPGFSTVTTRAVSPLPTAYNTSSINSSETSYVGVTTTTTTTTTSTTTSTTTTSTTTPTTTTTVLPLITCAAGFNRTIIMMKYPDVGNFPLFFRGGLGGTRTNAGGNTVALDYPVSPLGLSSAFAKYYYWTGGDTRLDWDGGEPGQRRYNGVDPAYGSPSAKTTNVPGNDAYYYLNDLGRDYWVLDTCMDCEDTYRGWFEFKSYRFPNRDDWETDVPQPQRCQGTSGEITPFTTNNRAGQCGRMNQYIRGENACTVNIIAGT